MSGFKKVKTSGKMFNSDPRFLRLKTLKTMAKITRIVGATLGPGGRPCLIESDLPGIPNKNTKDGVTVFRNLGSDDSFEHLIIEQARDAASRTVSEAGDGTTTATVLSEAIVRRLFNFCMIHPKYSPQKAMREINAVVKDFVVPYVRGRAIKADHEGGQDLLRKVAKVSANGDSEMADAVMEAFDRVGFSNSSHVIIQELTGPSGYEVEHLTGYPIASGYEESCGKFWETFITDRGNQVVALENPKFLLYNGAITDLVKFHGIIDYFGQRYTRGDGDFKNLVLVAHGFSESVLLDLSYNMADPKSLNVVPLRTPMNQIVNSQTEFLHDLAAFTGARVVGMEFNINELVAKLDRGGAEATEAERELLRCFGSGMGRVEIQRFRATVAGEPEEMNVQVRADDLNKRIKTAANAREREIIEERLGMLTSGIAKLKVYGASNGELKEKHDRCEDAVCAVRAAVNHGVLPGGCRVLLDLAAELAGKYGGADPRYEELVYRLSENMELTGDDLKLSEADVRALNEMEPNVVACVLVFSLLEPFYRLLENVGLTGDEVNEVLNKMMADGDLIYDAEKHSLGSYEELGIYDAEKAVEEAIKNATSIATVLGTLGGIIAYPRDHELERREARDIREYNQMVESPTQYANEVDDRI